MAKGKAPEGHPILCLNSGSSSLKFALYRMAQDEELVARGEAERIGLGGGSLRLEGGNGETLRQERAAFGEHRDAIGAAFDALEGAGLPGPAAVGHRVVHGGPEHLSPALVDGPLLESLRRLVPFAPLHMPREITGMETVAARFPGLPQVACFDTAFHRGLPEVAQRFPLPRRLWDEGVRRYGFHGLSYEYILGALGEAARGRVVIAHLGNGSSMAAVRDGRPVDTTMGFSPAGGFMMGTRSGDLDPGILVYLMREKGFDAGKVDRMVNHDSGLLGVSGESPDMKVLLEKSASDPRAALAVEMFCYHLAKHIGALAAALGGLDTLVFTGGIGEKAAPVRMMVCGRIGHLGVRLDPERNEAHADVVSVPESPCVVRVMPTREDLVIARHTRDVVFGGGDG
jgi:acetate kinase